MCLEGWITRQESCTSKGVTLEKSTGNPGDRRVLWPGEEDAWDLEQETRLGHEGLLIIPLRSWILASRQHRAQGFLVFLSALPLLPSLPLEALLPSVFKYFKGM